MSLFPKYETLIITFFVAVLASSFIHKDLNEYGKWMQFYKLNDESFVKKGTQQKIKPYWLPYDLSNEDKKLYNNLFFYSPDSSYYLDIDSYSLLLTKDFKGNITWEGGDPESKVQLINTKLQTSLTLLFFGSREYPETAIWRNKTLFEVCGFKEENNIFIPTLWKFDLATMTYQEFENKKKFNSRPKSYMIDERLKNIKMK